MGEGRPLGFRHREPTAPSVPAEPPPPAVPTLDDRGAAALLPARPPRGHKGTFGKLLVIAGSLDYAGAALLVCRAAGRAGAGLVSVAVPDSLQRRLGAKVTVVALAAGVVTVAVLLFGETLPAASLALTV